MYGCTLLTILCRKLVVWYHDIITLFETADNDNDSIFVVFLFLHKGDACWWFHIIRRSTNGWKVYRDSPSGWRILPIHTGPVCECICMIVTLNRHRGLVGGCWENKAKCPSVFFTCPIQTLISCYNRGYQKQLTVNNIRMYTCTWLQPYPVASLKPSSLVCPGTYHWHRPPRRCYFGWWVWHTHCRGIVQHT